jgi:hypothetical protein
MSVFVGSYNYIKSPLGLDVTDRSERYTDIVALKVASIAAYSIGLLCITYGATAFLATLSIKAAVTFLSGLGLSVIGNLFQEKHYSIVNNEIERMNLNFLKLKLKY